MRDEAASNFEIAEAQGFTTPGLPEHLLAKLRVQIPGYELLDAIDFGGQATVYRARELTSGVTVAVKVLHGGPFADPVARERLSRETATLKAISHPNIVCVIDSGRTPIGLDYLVMNFVDGRPLDDLWKDPKFAASVAPEPPARLRLFKRICDVVQVAHLKGITHRDLSPSNILITPDGQPHVLDFGLASTAFNNLLSEEGRNVSITGQFVGKIKYAAPEQARSSRDGIDIRTDVYALGVILYQILTNGAFPYEVVGNLVDVLNHIIHTQPLPPSAVMAAQLKIDDQRPIRRGPPLVNETIEAVVLKALEKNPADRYQSAGEFAADIDLYLAGGPTAAGLRGHPIKKAHHQTRLMRVSILAISILLITGALMNFRTLLNWIGVSAAVASLGTPAPASTIFDDDWVPPKPRVVETPASTDTTRPANTTVVPAQPVPAPTPSQVLPSNLVPPARRPIPDKAAQFKSRKLFEEVFKKELADRSFAGRRALAERLMTEAAKAESVPADQFLLLVGAADAAIEASDLPLCFKAADELSTVYDVDGVRVKGDLALKTTFRTIPAAVASENCSAGLKLVEQLVAAEDYATASRLLTALRSAAPDATWTSKIQDATRSLDALRAASNVAALGLQKLKANPDDPAANLAVGRFLCLFKNEWNKGLPLLAKGGNAPLSAAAALDLTQPGTSARQIEVGDGWWSLAESEGGPARLALKQRASRWYDIALKGGDIAGLSRTRLEQHVAAVPPKVDVNDTPMAMARNTVVTLPPPTITPPATINAPNPPASVEIIVPATQASDAPVPTGIYLLRGQPISLTPYAEDRWAKGSGTHRGKQCDYKGYGNRTGNWMALMWKVGNTNGAVVTSNTFAAPEAGELFLYCYDDKPGKNTGSIRVKIMTSK
jgi:serine/threonine protein kinase